MKGEVSEISGLGRWRHGRAWRWLSGGIVVLAVGISGYYVLTRLIASLRRVGEFQLAPAPLPLLLSLALTLLCVLAGGLIWHLVLRGVGLHCPLRRCLMVHLLANLGGYLPGYGWKFVGKGYLTQRSGYAVGPVSLAVLIEFLGLAITRLVVALTTMPTTFWGRWHLEALSPWMAWLPLGGWLFLGISPLLFVVTSKGLARRRRRPEMRLHLLWLYLALGLMCLTWIAYGLGLAALLEALQAGAADDVIPILFATTASSLVSLLLFVVPGGISVREGVVIYVLEGVLPDVVVTVGALLSRVVLIVAELVGALLGAWLARRDGLWK